MKYTYAYKTSDGIRHEDSMIASSREEVFERLRKQGIKAIKVVAADGSKANGEVRGVRKRVHRRGAHRRGHSPLFSNDGDTSASDRRCRGY